jgi:hypothetical protein
MERWIHIAHITDLNFSPGRWQNNFFVWIADCRCSWQIQDKTSKWTMKTSFHIPTFHSELSCNPVLHSLRYSQQDYVIRKHLCSISVKLIQFLCHMGSGLLLLRTCSVDDFFKIFISNQIYIRFYKLIFCDSVWHEEAYPKTNPH